MKKYVPYLIFALAALIFVIAGISACGQGESSSEPAEDIPTMNETTTERVDVYYRDTSGYLVPVTREIPTADGTEKNAVAMLLDTSENWSDAGMLGVMPTLPEGAKANVSMQSSIATVDLVDFVAESASMERLAKESLTATLLSCPNVNMVRFTVDGKATAMLPFGTSVGEPESEAAVNVEEGSLEVMAGSESTRMRLAFLNADGSMLVPITRIVTGKPGIVGQMSELLAGPNMSQLKRVVPEGCGLLAAEVANDTAVITLTDDFRTMSLPEQKLAAKAIVYTALQDPDVLDVVIRSGSTTIGEDVMGTELASSLNTAGDALSVLQTIGSSTNPAVENDVMPSESNAPATSNDPTATVSPNATVSPKVSPSPSPSMTPVRK